MRNGACVCGGEEAPWGVRARIALCSSGCVSAFCKEVELQRRKGSTSPATPEIPSPEKSPMGLTPAWWRKRSHTNVGGRCLDDEAGCGVRVSRGAPNSALGFLFRAQATASAQCLNSQLGMDEPKLVCFSAHKQLLGLSLSVFFVLLGFLALGIYTLLFLAP